MPSSSVRSAARAVVGALALGTGSLLSGASSASASDPLQFVISAADGYGIEDCMKPGQECGQVIADAWCESHGHGHASAYGSSDDVTGSTKISTSASPVPDHAIVIKCGE